MGKILEFLKKNELIISLLTKNFLGALILLTGLHFLDIIDINLFLRFRYFALIIVALLTFLLFLFFNKNKEEKKQKYNPYLKSFFLFGLLLLIFANLNFEPLSIITERMKSIENYIGAFTFVSGFFTFFLNLESIKVKEEKNNLYKIFIPLIFLTFILIRILMPIIYTGGYIGEYYNIMTGVLWFETGEIPSFYTNDEPYLRGLYVSFFVGLLTSIFGQTIFIAKMVPAITGTLSFFLFFLILKKLLKDKTTILLGLTIYTFTPFIIFNHFFIRFYAFYELFLFFKIWLFLKINESFEKKEFKNFYIFTSILIIFNLAIYFTSNDHGVYALLLITGIFLTYIFFKTVSLNFKSKSIIFLIFATIAFWFLDGISKIEYLTGATRAHPAHPEFGFSYLFFSVYLAYTILFLIAILILPKFFKKPIKKIMLLLPTIIFLLFVVSSEEIQLIRSMMVFLGLFFIPILLLIEKTKTFSKTLYYSLILITLGIIPTTYPEDFLKEPYLPGESPYTEFTSAFNYMKEKDEGTNVAVISGIPYLANFHEIEIDYFLNYEDNERRQWMDNDKVILGNIPIINNPAPLERENMCVLIREPSSEQYIGNYRTYLEESKNFHKTSFTRFTIYCNY